MLNAEQDILLRKGLDKTVSTDKLADIRRATSACGGNSWIRKFLSCGYGLGRLSLDEFFYYKLYDPDFSEEDCKRFVGKKSQHKFHLKCNDVTWFAAAHDKALFYIVAKGAGFLAPDTIAIYAPKKRSGFLNTLSTREDLAEFFRKNEVWPLFAKPIDGIYSIGTIQTDGVDKDAVRLKGHEEVSTDHLVEYINKLSATGYLFQRVVEPSSFGVANLTRTLSTVRVLVHFSDAEPRIESVVLKIPSGESIADNYWRKGNMLGAVNRDTGHITRVVSGVGAEIVELSHHPATHVDLTAMAIPNWSEIQDVALRAAGLFPAVRTQSWDIGLTSEGPMLIEFNFGGDLNLHQLAHRRGALTDEYIEHLRRCGYKKKLP